MDAFPALNGAPAAHQAPVTQDPTATAPDQPSAAQLLSQQHGLHLSYEEMAALNHTDPKSTTTAQKQPQAQPKANHTNGNGLKAGGTVQPDLDSESAFPSLGAPAMAPKTSSGWGQGPALSARLSTRPVGKNQQRSTSPLPPPAVGGQYTETLVMMLNAISIGAPPAQYRDRGPRAAGGKREEDPKNFQEVIKVVQRRHPTIHIDSSTSRDRATLLFRTSTQLPPKSLGSNHSPEQRVFAAKTELIARCAKKVTLTVQIPSSVRPFLIGTKGKTLKGIIDATGASINVPSREPGAGDDTEDDDTLIGVTISGEEHAALDAQAQILALARSRTARTTEKISTIPHSFYHLLNGAKGAKMAGIVEQAIGAEGAEEVNVFVPPVWIALGRGAGVAVSDEETEEAVGAGDKGKKRDDSIQITGDKDLVAKVVEAIEWAYAELERTTKSFVLELPKRQHRFLVGTNAEEILEATGCVVEVAPFGDPSEKVVIRGENEKNMVALQLVMAKANAQRVETIDLMTLHGKAASNPSKHAHHVSRYLLSRHKLRAIQSSHPTVKIYTPHPSHITPISTSCTIEIVGKEKPQVDAARKSVLDVVKELKPELFGEVGIDALVYPHLIGKKGLRIKAFQEAKGVDVIFPPASEEGELLLVYTGKEGVDAKTALEGVKAELLKLAKEAADIKTSTLQIPSKLHSYILGPQGTTLNAIIGEEKLVRVDVGPKDAPETVVVRGPEAEMKKVVAEIERLAEDGKQSDKINSYTVEFEVEAKYVSHIVGKAGSAVGKLRDELGVRIDFSEPSADAGKKRSSKAKAGVTIKGRKENVEEAKKRVLALADRLADEVSLNVPLPANVDRGAIVGKGGKYIIRLQETHFVHINFPRAGEDSEADVIVIRGPKKGCEAAKKELVDLMDYEREHGNSVSFTVSSRSIPRILGKGGIGADQIKEDTGVADINFDRDNEPATVTLRGTTKAIAAAKKKILSIANEVDDETTVELTIERVYHQALIGKGGTKVREIVQNAGGGGDTRMVQFPRQGATGEGADTVTLRGPKAIVTKIRAELEREVAQFKDRICIGVVVPRAGHPVIIGRGASGLKDLQSKHNVAIHPPGWREWATAGEPSNTAELADADDADIIKILGSAEACEAAAKELKTKGAVREAVAKSTQTIMVPARYHHQIAQGGRFFRDMPRGVRVDHGTSKVPAPAAGYPAKRETGEQPSMARIDADEDASSSTMEWDLHELNLSGDDTEIPWNITSNSAESASKVADTITAALEKAKNASFLAYATVGRHVIPRVVGRGGSGLAKLNATGAVVEIVGRRDSDTVSVVGSKAQLEEVKAMLEELL